MSRPIRTSQETWDRLERKVGTEGTADGKIGRLLDLVEPLAPQETGGTGEEYPAVDPAMDLHEALSEYPWFHSVGQANAELIVYLREESAEAGRTVPTRWGDIIVTTRVVGDVHPAAD